MTAEQRTTILFVIGVAAFLFLLSPLWPVERDPWPFIVAVFGMIGVPVFVARDRNGAKDDDDAPHPR